MRLDTGQHMHMGQQMKLVPRMIQSMEILQLGQAALEERIEQELASNPTLEMVESNESDTSIAQEIKQADRDDHENERELVVTDTATDDHASDFERLTNLSEQYGEAWSANTTEGAGNAGEGSDWSQRAARKFAGERDAKMDAMANTAARGASLYDQLIEQWHLLEVESPMLEAGEYLIGFLDADGYLRTDRQELMRSLPKEVTPDDIDEALEILQYELEPAGLGARSLSECLKIQIEDRIRRDRDTNLQLPLKLVSEHMTDIEGNRLPKIAKAIGIDVDQVKRGIMQLRQFTPHPGRLLVDDATVGITPDAVIDYDEETDTYTATLTNGRIPPLQVAPNYVDMLKTKGADVETRKFVGNHVRNGRWLIDAIEQRANTLLRVIGVVVEAQRGYFEEGQGALRPLPMTLVADQLGIHVATVSRAVADKYMQTPRGIVPLRMFFSGGTTSQDGQEMAWGAVQAKLKELIDDEDKSKPLSDDALVKALTAAGIEIARRTVAKYRGQMNIPTARQRREY